MSLRPIKSIAEITDEMASEAVVRLPEPVRRAIGGVMLLHAATLAAGGHPDQLSFAFDTWLRMGELTERQALAVLRSLARPEACGRFRFASELFAEVARRATLIAERDRSRRAAEERKTRPETQPGEVFKLAEAFRGVM